MTQPTLTREGITQALFSVLQGIPGMLTCSRRLLHWSELPEGAGQPALFLSVGNQTVTQDPDGLPAQWRLEYTVHAYVYNADEAVAPSTGLNNILDALEAALSPVVQGAPGWPGRVQVLGDLTGRIRSARISGQVETDEGVLGSQTMAVIPIEVVFHR